MDQLREITAHFQLEGTPQTIEPLGEGFINDTLIITTAEPEAPNYILQRKNKHIFTDIPAMMENIRRVTEHLKKKIVAHGGDPLREAMTLIPTHDEAYYFRDATDEYWTVTRFIDDTIAYQQADTPELARQGGRGIGLFQAMLADFTEPLTDILPGFHNMRFRLDQWDDTLRRDPVGRKRALAREIDWIESRRDQMLELWKAYERGEIPVRVTHNDTKINNILFDRNGEVLCVIDLDTVLNSMCLNDFGDAIRSYANTGREDDPDLARVGMSPEIFRSYTEGYLSQTASFLTEAERENLAFSALYITYEQVLRFLMDYLDGDHYYRTTSPDHNLVRTRAQYKLLQSMEAQYDIMRRTVDHEYKQAKSRTKC